MKMKFVNYLDFFALIVDGVEFLARPVHLRYLVDLLLCTAHPSCTQEVFDNRIYPKLRKFQPKDEEFIYKTDFEYEGVIA